MLDAMQGPGRHTHLVALHRQSRWPGRVLGEGHGGISLSAMKRRTFRLGQGGSMPECANGLGVHGGAQRPPAKIARYYRAHLAFCLPSVIHSSGSWKSASINGSKSLCALVNIVKRYRSSSAGQSISSGRMDSSSAAECPISSWVRSWMKL